MTFGLRLEAAASAFALAAGALAAAEGSGRPSLLEEVRAGPWKGVEEIVFATRLPYDDPHWYANIGTYCDDERKKAYAGNGAPDASGLYALLLRSREVRTILDARGGSVRDPQVAYDAEKVLFSYRPAGTDRYHLHEVRLDGSGLRQLTSGDFDDIEPAYLPDGDIVFVSTRCRRWVNCWMTEVATLHRANADGSDIRAISANTEHDNTPWVLPDGRILYTRWEYVDRSQVEFHHLWVMFPDGTGQTIYYGNLHPGVVMIDAKPIPGTAKVLANFSPGHGVNEHAGIATVVDPAAGPDDRSRARALHRGPLVRDPYPVTESCFLAARDDGIALLAEGGRAEILWRSPGPAKAHEPRPVERREREPILAARSDPRKGTGAMLLADVATSRNLPGVRRGEIRELLVLESLPKPVNFSGGPDLTSWLGTFTLERVLGTVPVEEDGSAYFEVPAGRQIFFVALDARGLSVKRMHSFTCAMPGEVVGCVGCHEPRTRAPENRFAGTLAALRGPPQKIRPFEGFPDVLDYHRDVQPILDRRCVPCHGYERREGKTLLGGDLGPEWAHGYFSLLARRQVADGRNGLGNQPPRSVGSSASPLLEKLRGGHHDARATEEEWRTAWLWIESGAPYAGTYAALRNAEAQAREPAAVGRAFGGASRVLRRRCASCHDPGRADAGSPLGLPPGVESRSKRLERIPGPRAVYERVVLEDDPLARFSVHVLLNFSRPEKSPLILAPLARAAGGWGICGEVFSSRDDPDCREILAAIEAGKAVLDAEPRYATPGFRPNRQYVRELKRFGVLPASFDRERDPIDPFRADEEYWRAVTGGGAGRRARELGARP